MSKKQQHHRDETMRKSYHITKHRYSERVATIYSSNIKNKLKVKTKQKIYRGQKFITWDRHKKCDEVKVILA